MTTTARNTILLAVLATQGCFFRGRRRRCRPQFPEVNGGFTRTSTARKATRATQLIGIAGQPRLRHANRTLTAQVLEAPSDFELLIRPLFGCRGLQKAIHY